MRGGGGEVDEGRGRETGKRGEVDWPVSDEGVGVEVPNAFACYC